jgi:hypothetical protein
MDKSDIKTAKKVYQKMFNVPSSDPLTEGVGELVDAIEVMCDHKK